MRLSKSEFAAWLKAKPPAEIVGTNRDCHSCPIANFYWEATGGCEVVISNEYGNGYVIDRGFGGRPMPYWAERFVAEIDGSEIRRISAEHALAALTPGGK